MHTRAIAGDNEKRKFILFNVLLLLNFSNSELNFCYNFQDINYRRKKHLS